jgi:IstB-like ATP binding protein
MRRTAQSRHLGAKFRYQRQTRPLPKIGPWPGVFADARMTTALLDGATHHYEIGKTGNDSWRFKIRDDDQETRARAVSASHGSCAVSDYPHRLVYRSQSQTKQPRTFAAKASTNRIEEHMESKLTASRLLLISSKV